MSQSSIGFIKQVFQQNNITSVNDSTLSYRLPYNSTEITTKILFLRNLLVENGMIQNDTFKKTLGLSSQEFLAACTFSGLPCDSYHLTWYYDKNYGNCFQFNTGRNTTGSSIAKYKTSITGKRSGLNLILFTGLFNDENNLSFDTGAHVFVGNGSFAVTSADGLDAAAGN